MCICRLSLLKNALDIATFLKYFIIVSQKEAAQFRFKWQLLPKSTAPFKLFIQIAEISIKLFGVSM